MCNAGCIDEAIKFVHIEICIFSELIDISEMLSSSLSWSNDFSRVLSVSRGMRFWEASRIFWTILSVSRGMLNRITSRFCISFFPSPHLRVSYAPRDFKGYSNNLVPQVYTSCCETRQHAFPFAVGDPGEELSWDLFDISDCFPAKRKEWLLYRWLQENVVSFMILKRCKKLCHSSRVKLPLVRMSASWFLDSTYLIWTFWAQV